MEAFPASKILSKEKSGLCVWQLFFVSIGAFWADSEDKEWKDSLTCPVYGGFIGVTISVDELKIYIDNYSKEIASVSVIILSCMKNCYYRNIFIPA